MHVYIEQDAAELDAQLSHDEGVADQYGIPWPAVVAYRDDMGQDAPIIAVADAYYGEWDSLEDWAEDWLDESGTLSSLPENLRPYFDVSRWARDAAMDLIVAPAQDGGVYIFSAH